MQASRPRALITPLQLGLGVQVLHNFASRFLMSTLNSLGFCSSYYEVQKFESSAAAVQGTDLPGDVSNSFVQFVVDNVDHNTKTIDGLNTFHGMGIIAGITPGTKRTQPIPRIAFSSDEIKALAKVLRQFIKAKRTGNWPLHLQSIQAMLPFLAASGHNLYTKTAYIYLMTMQSLDEDNPDGYASFINGNHVIRRSNRYWAEISSDLFIEQVLMSVKTAGGLTRGRGMTKSQRSLWLMSMPACAEINQAMQDLSGVGYFSSEQHKDETRARQKKDTDDIQTLLTFLKGRNSFIEPEVDRSLRNIETEVVADKIVNVDDAKKVGTCIIQELVGKNIADHTFRRKKQAITLENKVHAKLLE
ncbi:unnamed protein product [Mytilus coruscus]|uniref:Uncharacterized protein n=1 Tax=Mytilus coruscus TaxID=42192 RepID=A0A6J8EHH2_MYTCO|nr:unnamed protein product [Mytilus coruscus]